MEANTLNYSVNKSIRLLLVDDSELFRKFITELLADNSALSIIGEAADGNEALEILGKSNPDVILLDMEMPVMDGKATMDWISQIYHCGVRAGAVSLV